MKVICIDTTPSDITFDLEALYKLIEGDVYTAYNSPHPDGLFLVEVPTKNPAGFNKNRFIPLSQIDEKKLIEENESNLVKL